MGVLVLAACSGDGFRDDDGRIVEAGQASVFDLQVGDCLDPGHDAAGEISEVRVVPCEEPHTQELFGVVMHPDDAYPGASEVAAYADGACLNELESSLELTLDDGLYFSYILPTFDGWNAGSDRQILCVLVFPQVEAMTGSVVEGTATIEPRPPAPPQEPDEEPDGGDDEDEDVRTDAAPAAGTGA